MATTMSIDQLIQMKGKDVFASDGEKVGKIEDVYVDDQTDRPEWISLSSGIFGNKHQLVPVEGASAARDGLKIPYSKDQVKDTPSIDQDQLSEEQERGLYQHYGLHYGFDQSGTGLPQGGQTQTRDRDITREPNRTNQERSTSDSMTVSEEQMRIDKREAPAGHVRLRKWVETRPVEENVRLREETASIERQPLNERTTNAQIGNQEIEMELRREEPVVEKETVAKERVGLKKDVQQREETVRGEVREEHVEMDKGGDRTSNPRFEEEQRRSGRDFPGTR